MTIPNSVTSIGDDAFSGCSSLSIITVDANNPKYDSRDNCNAIIEKSTNTLIVGCKTTNIPNSVTSIGNSAFFGCSGLTSVTIPNSVTSIGRDAFYGCSGLTSVTIPNSVTSIGDDAFYGCSGLTSVTIPNSVTSIGKSAFQGCRGLTSVTIPNSVTSIGNVAFNGCSGLTSVKSEIENPFAIESDVFIGIHSTAKLIVPKGTKTKYQALSGWTANFKEIIEEESIITNDKSQPTPVSLKRDADNASVQLNFSEEIVRGEGIVTAKYYKEWDIMNPVYVPAEDIAIEVSGNVATFAAANIPAGAYLCFSYAAGAFIDKTGNPCGALNSGLNMNTGKFTGAYVHVTNKAFDIDDAYVTPVSGTSVGDWEAFKGTVTFPYDIFRNDETVEQGDIKVSYINGDRNATYNLTAKQWAVEGNRLTFELPTEPAIGDYIEVTVRQGAVADVYGNYNNEYDSKHITWKYVGFVPTKEMLIGPFELSYISYWSEDGSASSLGVITIEENTEKENALIIKNLFIEGSVIEATYDLEMGKLIIADDQELGKFTDENGTYTTYFYTADGKDAATFTINRDGSLEADGLWGIYVINDADASAKGWRVVAKVSELTPIMSTIELAITPNPSVPYETLNSVTLTCGRVWRIALADKSKVILTDSDGKAVTTNIINTSPNVYTITFDEITTPGTYVLTVAQGAFTFEFEGNTYPVNAITTTYIISEVQTYTLSIKATGNGATFYDGKEIRSNEDTFILKEGSSATFSFSPDEGYRIKSVMVNNSDLTSEIEYNKYTIDSINNNFAVEVEFEKIAGNEGQSYAFILGSWNAIGYDYFSDGAKKEWTASFDKDPIGLNKVWIYNICSGGCSSSYPVYGIVSEDKTEIRIPVGQTTNKTSSYDVILEGFRDDGKTKIENGDYIIGKISEDDTIIIEDWFGAHAYNAGTTTSAGWYSLEMGAILKKQSPASYMLTIKSTGNGSAVYNGTDIRNSTPFFMVFIGSTITITFVPDKGYRIMSVKVNGVLVASDVSGYQYTVSNFSGDTMVEVEFMEELMAFSSNGVNYSIMSYDDKMVTVVSGSYGKALEVPANVSYQEKTWKVTGIDNATMADNAGLAAVIWNPETQFTPNVSNPNFLLYVKSADYATSTVKNVVVSGNAKSITLTDATNGNDFYCPQEFTAQRISYTHNYMMTTGIGESRGWETIALPFDVQQVTHQSGGELVPFGKWQSGNEGKPFWLMELGSSGWTEATAIKANTPYIISMPNNENYKPEFRVNGNVTFKAENVTVRRSDEVESGKGNGKTFVPNFTNQESAGYYALNVSNDYVTYSGGAAEGSRFVAGLRPVRPFEAYMTSEAGVREIAIADDLATGIAQAIVLIGGRGDTKVYDLKGRVVADGAGCSQEELRRMLPYGVYIFNGRKLIVK